MQEGGVENVFLLKLYHIIFIYLLINCENVACNFVNFNNYRDFSQFFTIDVVFKCDDLVLMTCRPRGEGNIPPKTSQEKGE